MEDMENWPIGVNKFNVGTNKLFSIIWRCTQEYTRYKKGWYDCFAFSFDFDWILILFHFSFHFIS